MGEICAALLVVMGCVSACTDDTPDPGGDGGAGGDPAIEPVEGPCPPPNRMVGGACLEPGVQDDGCAAGTWHDGSGCREAGVGETMCAPGFVHDARGGCAPVLPAAPCSEGVMAVPGDRSCRPVASCGTGKWGNIPIDDDTVFVEAGYPSADSDGSQARPWTTVTDALAAAAAGGLVAIAAGSYAEQLVMNKPVRLWGVCPQQVEITGTAASFETIHVASGASGAHVRDLAIRSRDVCIFVSGTQELVLERLHFDACGHGGLDVANDATVTVRGSLVEDSAGFGLHVGGAELVVESTAVVRTHADANDNGGEGVEAQGFTGSMWPTRLTVRGSLIADNVTAGVAGEAADVVVEGSVVRHTQPGKFGRGRGISVQPHWEGATGSAIVRSSVVAANHEAGIFMEDGVLMVESTVVRDTRGLEDGGGFGILVQQVAGTAAATVRSSLVAGNVQVGMVSAGADVLVESTIFRDTRPHETLAPGGRGFEAAPGATSGVRPVIVMRGSVVEDCIGEGIHIVGADVELTGVAVRDIQPHLDGRFGRGISVQASEVEPLASAVIRASVFERTSDIGIFLAGASGRVESSIVRDVAFEVGENGRGVAIQPHPTHPNAVMVDLRDMLIERSHEAGVAIAGADVHLERCRIVDTRPVSGERFGDGVVVWSSLGFAGRATLSNVRIEESARAAISSFGATVTLADSWMRCQPIDLNGEPVDGVDAFFEILGGNLCGCPDAALPCELKSDGLAPPSPIAPIE